MAFINIDFRTINWWKVIVIAGIMTLCGYLGYQYGENKYTRCELKQIIYRHGTTVKDTVYFDKEIEIIHPVDTARIIEQCVYDGKFYELFPEKVKDSIIIVTKSDTTKIMADWASTRTYKSNLFDIDTVGRFDYDIEVQYNELKKFSYSFIPIQKTTITDNTITKRYSPFVGAGLSMNNSINVVGGLFFNDSWGFSVNARYNVDNMKYDGLPKYDFGVNVIKKF